MGYLMTAADHEESVNLTDPEWRALIYVASQHDFSAPHLRVEKDDEAVDVDRTMPKNCVARWVRPSKSAKSKE